MIANIIEARKIRRNGRINRKLIITDIEEGCQCKIFNRLLLILAGAFKYSRRDLEYDRRLVRIGSLARVLR